MTTPTLRTLGRKLREKRGGKGIRAAAAEVGISPATFSRVERGLLPDLDTPEDWEKWRASRASG